jgi:site-specific recombinase XerD
LSRSRQPDSAFVFATERSGPFTPDAINRLIKRIGARARFAFLVHAHMLRGAFRTGSVIGRSNTRCATRS